MKKPTKILALLLALFMALTVFVACDKKDDGGKENKAEKTEETAKPEEKKVSAEDEVRVVVRDFCNDFNKGKMDALESYFTADADVAFLEDLNFAEQFEGAEALGLTEADVDEIVGKIFAAFEFEIDKVEVSGDEATVELTMTAPEVDALDMSGVGEEKIVDFMESQGYTLEELEAMGEEESEALLMELMPKMMKWMVEEALKSAPTTSETQTLTLVKEGNEWLISE